MAAPRNGFGITAFALAMVGLLFCLMPITGFIGLGLGLLAFLFAALGLSRVNKGQATNKKMTITALVLSVLAIVFGFIAMKMFFDIVSDLPGAAKPPPSAVASAGAGQSDATAVTSPGGEFSAGQTADRDGLQITADPLEKVKPQYLDPVLCTKVSYVNNSGSEQRYNAYDWKLQNPNGNIANPAYSGEPDLPSGSIAPGGKVAGRVCFTDPRLKGDYTIINEEMFSSGSAARWTAAAP